MKTVLQVKLKMLNMKNKITTLLIIFILSFFVFQKTEARVPVAVPFGGPIIMSYECSCSGGWLVTVFDYTLKIPVPMTFQFGESMIRANYNIYTPSVQTLGSYTPVGWCSPASTSCYGFPTTGTISPIGLPGIGTGAI